jgi:hypothetical protein
MLISGWGEETSKRSTTGMKKEKKRNQVRGKRIASGLVVDP